MGFSSTGDKYNLLMDAAVDGLTKQKKVVEYILLCSKKDRKGSIIEKGDHRKYLSSWTTIEGFGGTGASCGWIIKWKNNSN